MATNGVKVRETPPPRNPEAGTWDWRLRAIHWGAVFEYQNWGAIPIVIPAIVLVILAHYSFQEHPRYRDAYLYDAHISYPLTEPTVSNGTASLYPWLAMLISVFLVEYGLYYQQQSVTAATAAVLHVLLSCLVNFIIVLAASEVTKAVVGNLRPNFLARCQPDPAQLAQPFGFQEAVKCTTTDTAGLNQARLSFVSGHASNTLCVSWFTTLYLIWSLYWRDCAPYATQVFGGGHGKWMRRLMYECLYALFYWWMLFCLLLSWYIGCSRIWDNEHTAADVVGGLMLALLLTTPYVFKTFGQYAVFKRELDIFHDTTVQGAKQLAAAQVVAEGSNKAATPPIPEAEIV